MKLYEVYKDIYEKLGLDFDKEFFINKTENYTIIDICEKCNHSEKTTKYGQTCTNLKSDRYGLLTRDGCIHYDD